MSGKPSSPKDEKSVKWVPSLNLPELSKNGVCVENLENYPISTNPDEINLVRNEDDEALENSGLTDEEEEETLEEKYRTLQEKCAKLQEQCNTLEEKCDVLEDECHNLKGKCDKLEEDLQKLHLAVGNAKINEELFFGNDEKTRYLTGFPTQPMLTLMFTDCDPYMKGSPLSALTKFQKFVLTLMRLCLNVEFRFLGNYFCVSEITASRVFKEVVPIMNARFESLIFWPSREKLYETMPLQFRESDFGKKVVVIIDCFDVEMEAPSNLMAAAQVYSHYQKSKRVKFLIGVTPQGSISFLSKGYGGRSSDKFITEDCDFVKKLVPGDIALADRGFLIHDAVRFLRAEIFMPAFKGECAVGDVMEAT